MSRPPASENVFSESLTSKRRFIFVSTDNCMGSILITQKVLAAIRNDTVLSQYYNDSNVAIRYILIFFISILLLFFFLYELFILYILLSGIHTHSAPAGFLQYLLFQIPSLGISNVYFTLLKTFNLI